MVQTAGEPHAGNPLNSPNSWTHKRTRISRTTDCTRYFWSPITHGRLMRSILLCFSPRLAQMNSIHFEFIETGIVLYPVHSSPIKSLSPPCKTQSCLLFLSFFLNFISKTANKSFFTLLHYLTHLTVKVLYSILTNINAAWSHFTDVSAEYSSETMQIKKKKKKTNFQEILADRLTIKY